jgi:Secretion system C-terminal sorting domain
MLTDLLEHWSNAQWVFLYRSTRTYDANGHMLTDLYEEWSNGHWVNSSSDTYTYDATGHMLTDLHESWLNTQWVNYWRITYAYDAHGNATSYWYESWSALAMSSSWSVVDGAGNNYFFGECTSVTLIWKLNVTGVSAEDKNLPQIHTLSQNYPNPFNPSTTIKYELPKSTMVRLSVYDLLGREVSALVNDRRNAGVHEVKFDGSGLSSGVYFYRLQAGDFVQTRKLLLTR